MERFKITEAVLIAKKANEKVDKKLNDLSSDGKKTTTTTIPMTTTHM